MVGEGANTLKAEAEKSLGNLITVLLEIVLPIVLFFIGLGIVAPAIGLSGFYGTLVGKTPQIPATAVNVVGAAAAILTYLAVGGGLIAVERLYEGWGGDVVGAFGWLFMGAGLRELLAWLWGNSPLGANSILTQFSDRLQSGLTTAVQGG